jgi:hypothetical protein
MKSDGAGNEQATSLQDKSAHPGVTSAGVRIRAGKWSFEAKARTTTPGIVAISVLLGAILVPIVFIIQRSKASE